MRLGRSIFRTKPRFFSGRPVLAGIDRKFLTLKSIDPPTASSLRRSLFLASALVLLMAVTVSAATSVQAQSQTAWTSNGWVSSGAIFDLTGNADLAPNSALIAGHSYNLTLQINVPNTSTSTPNFEVMLNTRVLAAAGQSVYWTIHNPSFPGYDRTNFIPGGKTVTFNYTQGTLRLSAYFQVPTNFTNPSATFVTPSGNVTESLHLPQNNVVLVGVVPVGSTGVGYFSASVSDQTLQTYANDYNQTADLVPSGKISSTYSSLVNSIIAEAQALNKLGLPDQGTTLLNALVPSAFPVPPSSSLQTYLLVGLALTIVVVVLLAVMTIRSRGKSGYSVGIINDVQKDLAVLEVTAAKYDKAMADKLKSIRDKLSESN
jgi:hypothetical protein